MNWTNSVTSYYSCEGNESKCGNAFCNCDAEFLNDLTVLLVDVLIGDPTLDPWEMYPFSDYDKSECQKTPAAQRRPRDCRK